MRLDFWLTVVEMNDPGKTAYHGNEAANECAEWKIVFYIVDLQVHWFHREIIVGKQQRNNNVAQSQGQVHIVQKVIPCNLPQMTSLIMCASEGREWRVETNLVQLSQDAA